MPFPRHVLGLPMHPMLVHFPLVLWVMTPLCDGLALWRSISPWWQVGWYCTLIGVGFGAMALLTGLLDYIHLSDTGSNDVRLAARHGVRTSMVWCVMTGKLFVIALNPAGAGLIAGTLVVDTLACLLLLQGALFGTRITYGHYGG